MSKRATVDDLPTKIEPYSDEWERRANSVARGFVIIKSCRDCGSPVIQGYCCTYCDSVEP